MCYVVAHRLQRVATTCHANVVISSAGCAAVSEADLVYIHLCFTMNFTGKYSANHFAPYNPFGCPAMQHGGDQLGCCG